MRVLPSADPHGLGDDDLETGALPVDLTAGDDRVLAGVSVEPLEPQPAGRGVADRGAQPDGVELELGLDQRVAAPPGSRTLDVKPAAADRHADVSAELLALRRPAEAEGRYEAAFEGGADRCALDRVRHPEAEVGA